MLLSGAFNGNESNGKAGPPSGFHGPREAKKQNFNTAAILVDPLWVKSYKTTLLMELCKL